MFWLIGIAGVWTFCCLMAVALCVAASRGDERLSLLLATVREAPVDVDFVPTFAASEPLPRCPRLRPPPRSARGLVS